MLLPLGDGLGPQRTVAWSSGAGSPGEPNFCFFFSVLEEHMAMGLYGFVKGKNGARLS